MFALLSFIAISIIANGQTWYTIDVPTSKKLNAIDFPSNQVGYIVGDSSVLLKSTNGGFDWSIMNHTGLVTHVNQSISDVQFLTDDLGFAVTNGSNGGIFKTTNGGATWSPIPDTITNGFCFFNSIYMFNETNGVIGGNGCFSGSILEQIVNNEYVETNVNLFTGVYQGINDIDFLDANIGLAASLSHYVYRTTDGGASWDSIPTNLDPNYGQVNGIRFLNADTAFASYTTSATSYGVLISTDGGLTWDYDMNSATFLYPNFLCVAKNNQNKIYVGGEASGIADGVIFTYENNSWMYYNVDEPIYDIDSYGNDITFGVGDSGLVVVNRDPSTIGIQNVSLSAFDLNVYPIPSNEVLNIESSDVIEDVQIIDLNGRVVLHEQPKNKNNTIGVSHLSNGAYMLKVSAKGKHQIQRWIKN